MSCCVRIARVPMGSAVAGTRRPKARRDHWRPAFPRLPARRHRPTPPQVRRHQLRAPRTAPTAPQRLVTSRHSSSQPRRGTTQSTHRALARWVAEDSPSRWPSSQTARRPVGVTNSKSDLAGPSSGQRLRPLQLPRSTMLAGWQGYWGRPLVSSPGQRGAACHCNRTAWPSLISTRLLLAG